MTFKFLKPLSLAYLAFAFTISFLFDVGKISTTPIFLGIALFMGYFLVRGLQSFQLISSPNRLGWFVLLGILGMMLCQLLIVWGGIPKTVPMLVFAGLLFALWYVEFKYTEGRDLGLFLVVLAVSMGAF